MSLKRVKNSKYVFNVKPVDLKTGQKKVLNQIRSFLKLSCPLLGNDSSRQYLHYLILYRKHHNLSVYRKHHKNLNKPTSQIPF